MAKLYIVSNPEYDIIIVPGIMAAKLNKYYWVAIHQLDTGPLDEWGEPPDALEQPVFPQDVGEKEIKDIISQAFGKIIAERSDTEDDEIVVLDGSGWERLNAIWGVPSFDDEEE